LIKGILTLFNAQGGVPAAEDGGLSNIFVKALSVNYLAARRAGFLAALFLSCGNVERQAEILYTGIKIFSFHQIFSDGENGISK
jgi:hypothetical protein